MAHFFKKTPHFGANRYSTNAAIKVDVMSKQLDPLFI